MNQHDVDEVVVNINDYPRKKTAAKAKTYQRFIPLFTLSPILIFSVLVASASTYPAYATLGQNETEATVAPSGTSLESAGSGANVTQSDCLLQNTTTTGRSAVGAGNATAAATNNTTTTFAPGGASIGANDTSTLNATAGRTTTATNNTTATFAPSGASVC